ncbi:inositol monophosphatase family protein [Maliponia aquimaris]|uniref:Inositol-1-monophosphatase n=1 Tax=Maliponia aquimaris TaxID=1673631 RepID=A0A238L4M2_9RHOB|nr:inositol monophosphatase family protein [Maliponia aquimaris]SMX50033.1 Inositol-1-monophosphatase [Maliponia aquimaris]
MTSLDTRKTLAVDICRTAGDLALSYFSDRAGLRVDSKGAQDWVSDADREVELHVRKRLSEALPQDGIFGEEGAPTPGTSGYDWVIDPIDGTTNFVHGIPAWTVVLACVHEGRTVIGVIHDPLHNETYVATAGGGATLNGVPLALDPDKGFASGTVGVGYSNRVKAQNLLPVIEGLMATGAMIHRNASGALSLAYVAAGRLLGYVEEHMNAWDCLAGQLLVAEAGGRVEPQDVNAMIKDGGRVVVSGPAVFDDLVTLADAAWGRPT